MPKRKRKPDGFRINAKKVGLTYSCPVAWADNPIPNCQAIADELLAKFGPAKYIIGEELHESGKRHYHAYFNFDAKLDVSDARAFDLHTVHPNFTQKAPGAGWMDYCKKDKKYISNIAKGPYQTALSCPSANEALEHLWQNAPRDMATQGHNIERNIRARFSPAFERKIYYGPYPKHFYPENWNHNKHSLLLWGPPDTCKTQFAQYLLRHAVGTDIAFVKKNPELLKGVALPFVFDEINMLERSPDDSREITDVENPSSISARNKDADIPPVPRIFIANFEHPFKNPYESVYGRRVVTHPIASFSANACEI